MNCTLTITKSSDSIHNSIKIHFDQLEMAQPAFVSGCIADAVQISVNIGVDEQTSYAHPSRATADGIALYKLCGSEPTDIPPATDATFVTNHGS